MVIEVLYDIDPTTMVLLLLGVIFFLIIQFALSRALKDKSTSTYVAFCISLLSVYGLNRTNFDVSGLFSSIGIDGEILYIIAPIVLLIGLIFMVWKIGLPITLTIAGILLIAGSFFVYEKVIVMGAGIAFIIVGIMVGIWKKTRGKIDPNKGGIGKTKKSPGYALGFFAFVFGILLLWYGFFRGGGSNVIGAGIGLIVLGIIFGIFGWRRNKKKDLVNPNYNSNYNPKDPKQEEKNRKREINERAKRIEKIREERRQKGIDTLIKAAKKFKDWAKAQKNPKFYGTWAMFINWLKGARWGNNEKEICKNLGITVDDFVWVFKKYGKV